MRHIKGLTPETLKMLTRIEKTSNLYQVRQRALCIKLSYKGYTMEQLTKMFNVTRSTIYHWFNNWEKMGLAGLYNTPGRGRKKILNPEQEQEVKAMVQINPDNLNAVKSEIYQKWGINISKDTIKRITKQIK